MAQGGSRETMLKILYLKKNYNYKMLKINPCVMYINIFIKYFNIK